MNIDDNEEKHTENIHNALWLYFDKLCLFHTQSKSKGH